VVELPAALLPLPLASPVALALALEPELVDVRALACNLAEQPPTEADKAATTQMDRSDDTAFPF
jgi:hypothetical protein